jgi:hypothetical protein
MRMGSATARRGWVEPRHVLNTRPLAEVRAFIAASAHALSGPCVAAELHSRGCYTRKACCRDAHE